MARPPVPVQPKATWLQTGAQMMAQGDYRGAVRAFEHAVRQAKGNGLPHYYLAHAHLALRQFGSAAEELTDALRLKPDLLDAASQLGELASARSIPANVKLNRIGLRAALDFDRINRDQIAEVAVYFLAERGPLHTVLEMGRKDGFLAAARSLCLTETAELLKDDLLQKALRDNIIRMPELEELLVALRRVLLLEVPAGRHQDRSLIAFIITLLRQCTVNEYVWSMTPEEGAELTGRPCQCKHLSNVVERH